MTLVTGYSTEEIVLLSLRLAILFVRSGITVETRESETVTRSDSLSPYVRSAIPTRQLSVLW
jgi:hypothetical protein